MRVTTVLAALLALLAGATLARAQTPATMPVATSDQFIWLEELNGARAMAWVKEQNAKTLAVLQNDPNFSTLYADALKIAQAKDRIPVPSFIGGQVYNFWQDTDHVRGIWRRTSPADYAGATPTWTTVLDLDALARSENANWVWKGADCVWPAENRCMISLSDGGEDAITVREFDLSSATFVDGGLVLPRGKQRFAWESGDTLLVSREWSPGELTASGYPYVVKRVVRGKPLSEAVEVFRGSKSDGGYGVTPEELHDGAGHSVVLIDRPLSTFTSQTFIMTSAGARRLDVPLKSQPQGLVDGRLLFTIQQRWTVNGTSFPAGSLISLDLDAARSEPNRLRPALVYTAGPRATLDGVAQTSSRLLLTTYENVRGREWVYAPVPGGWSKQRLDLPDNSSIVVNDADQRGETAYITVTSFLTPPTLWQLDAATGALRDIKTSPARFDASQDVAEQREATSKDGTRIPYFIVHPKTMKLDGSNPTLLYAYGGFDVSVTPNYNGIVGKLWLERGGVYAAGQYSRRRRVRGGVARGRAYDAPPARLRRLRCGRPRSDRHQSDQPAPLGNPRRFQWRVADGRRVYPASGALERGRHSSSAARHVALRADSSRSFVDGGVRQRCKSCAARVPCLDLALQQSTARREVPRAVHLDDDQRRSRRPAARPQVRRKNGSDALTLSLLRGRRGRPRRRS